MLKKSLFIVSAMSFPLFGQAQNMDPKTEQEYAQVIMECYAENIPKEERWEELKFSYTRGKKTARGKKKFLYQPSTLQTIKNGRKRLPVIRWRLWSSQKHI